MFGRRSNKPPATPWPVQVLTSEYVIEGYCDPEDTLFQTVSMADSDENVQIVLKSAQVRPAGSLSIASFTCREWIIDYWTGVVAVIPRDMAGQKALQEEWESAEYPLRAELFAGPYLLRGMVMSDEEERLSYPGAQIYITEAEIECLLPGAQLGRLNAPMLVLNGTRLDGYYLL